MPPKPIDSSALLEAPAYSVRWFRSLQPIPSPIAPGSTAMPASSTGQHPPTTSSASRQAHRGQWNAGNTRIADGVSHSMIRQSSVGPWSAPSTPLHRGLHAFPAAPSSTTHSVPQQQHLPMSSVDSSLAPTAAASGNPNSSISSTAPSPQTVPPAPTSVQWQPFPRVESDALERQYRVLVDSGRLVGSSNLGSVTVSGNTSPTQPFATGSRLHPMSSKGSAPDGLNPSSTNMQASTAQGHSHFLQSGADQLEPAAAVIVGEDLVMEVDIEHRLQYPIYWPGSHYRVCRATWFYQDSSSKWQPLDELLAKQIEDGYLKYRPWLVFPYPSDRSSVPPVTLMGSSSASFPSPDPPVTPTSSAVNSNNRLPPDRFKWNLFGPYSHQHTLEARGGWLMSDHMSAKLAKMIFSTLSSGENLGGSRLLRGYDQVCRFLQQSTSSSSTSKQALRKKKSGTLSSMVDSMAPVETPSSVADFGAWEGLNEAAASMIGSEMDWSDLAKDRERQAALQHWLSRADKIRHLVFVVHGIGQKMSDKMQTGTVQQDVDAFRKTMRSNLDVFRKAWEESEREKAPAASDSKSFPKAAAHPHNSTLPSCLDPNSTLEDLGLMLIPVEWRSKLRFELLGQPGALDIRHPHFDFPSIRDITLEAVPTMRNIISDVLLDVLLYMSPHHREEMIEAIVTDMNKIYRLFLERHPRFEEQGGQIHVVGHSLGSVVSMDVLTHHSYSRFRMMLARDRRDDRKRAVGSRWCHRSSRLSRDPQDLISPIDLSDIALQALSASRPRGMSSPAPLASSPLNIQADYFQWSQDQAKAPSESSLHEGPDIARTKTASDEKNGQAALVEGMSMLNRHSPWADKKPFVAPFSRFDPQDHGIRSKYLSFPVTKFFAFGSPLGLFLLLRYSKLGSPLKIIMEAEYPHMDRHSDPSSLQDEPFVDMLGRTLTNDEWARLYGLLDGIWSRLDIIHPDVACVYNIFHPNDPIAYRIEPLVSPSLATMKPVVLPSVRGGWKLNLDLSSHAQVLFGSLGSLRDTLVATVALRSFTVPGMTTSTSSPPSRPQQERIELETMEAPRSNTSTLRISSKRTPDDLMKLLNGRKGRLDFALQESMLESQYLSALWAHLLYWQNQNCTFFVLGELLEL